MLARRFLSIGAASFVCAVAAASGLALPPAFAQRGSSNVAQAIDAGAPPAEAAPKQVETIFDNGNIYAVKNRPTRATVFTLNAPTKITRIQTYHWNNGRGAPAGTIALRSSSGEMLGPWQAAGQPGQGGVPSAYWVVELEGILPAGTYTVIDSNPSTWAQNAGTGGAGFVGIMGIVE